MIDESIVVFKDTPYDGSLVKGESATYILTGVSNWRLVNYGFKASTYDLSIIFYYSSKNDFFTVVAKATIECDSNKMEFNLVDGLPSVYYHDGINCSTGNSTITITNLAEEDVTFWGIAADQDRIFL